MTTGSGKHTAAYKIFHYPFQIKIPQVYLSSIAEKESLPQWTTGNREEDRIAAQQMVTVVMTIDKMIDFFNRKIRIEFNSMADIERIYETILEHIQDYRNYVGTSTWLPDQVPFDDLRVMNDFAEKIYYKVRGSIARKVSTSAALTALEGECSALVSLNAFAKPNPNEVFEQASVAAHPDLLTETKEVFERRFKSWR